MPGTAPGKRVQVESAIELNPGEYWQDAEQRLWIMPPIPEPPLGMLVPTVHTITQHEDGTISVHPSIKIWTTERTDPGPRTLFHGWLRHGTWEWDTP
jgi:hypothetical protein